MAVVPIQDTIDFVLSAEHTVVNTTVKMVATIASIITADMTEAKLKENIKEMMKKFVSDANWQFSGMTRNSHASGMEELTLIATARVSEAENYALDKRARDVSQEGMSITGISTDPSPPASMIEEAEGLLRQRLLTKATKELGDLNNVMAVLAPNGYRINSVVFQTAGNEYANSRGVTMAATVAKSSYGSGFGADMGGGEDALGNAVKLTMRANVKLARVVA
jgi:hypothetical protein